MCQELYTNYVLSVTTILLGRDNGPVFLCEISEAKRFREGQAILHGGSHLHCPRLPDRTAQGFTMHVHLPLNQL